jgi:hypothetical protein
VRRETKLSADEPELGHCCPLDYSRLFHEQSGILYALTRSNSASTSTGRVGCLVVVAWGDGSSLASCHHGGVGFLANAMQCMMHTIAAAPHQNCRH